MCVSPHNDKRYKKSKSLHYWELPELKVLQILHKNIKIITSVKRNIFGIRENWISKENNLREDDKED